MERTHFKRKSHFKSGCRNGRIKPPLAASTWRKTFNSLPKKLPNRKHIILSLDNKFNKEIEDSEVYSDKSIFIARLQELAKDKEIFIIGGASIYNIFINIADRLLLTEIEAEDKEADVYFPHFEKLLYKKRKLGENEENCIQFKYMEYIKK